MRQGALIGPTIIAIGLVVAAILFSVVGALLQSADGAIELRLARGETERAALTATVSQLDQDLREVRQDFARLREEIALAASQPRGPEAPVDSGLLTGTPGTSGDPSEFGGDAGMPQEGLIGDHPETEVLTEEMRLAKSRFNIGIGQPRNSVMLELLGQPRDSYGTDCQGVTDPRLKALLETRTIGPITVTMLRPALDSLERIMTKLQQNDPDIYAAVGTAGTLCVRFIRGSRTSISNHSWGTAVDIKLEGKLDGFADGGTQFGLLIIAELFNEEGWFWGATYNREDSMHFEVGTETLRRWAAEGLL